MGRQTRESIKYRILWRNLRHSGTCGISTCLVISTRKSSFKIDLQSRQKLCFSNSLATLHWTLSGHAGESQASTEIGHPNTLLNPPQLVLLTGYPSSGKSHRASQLVDFFKSKIAANTALPAHDSRISRLKVHHVSDQTLGLTRDVYREARSEKVARAAEYSAIKRLLGRDDIVVADGLNYIKGFRYQLFCDAKAVSTPSCVVSSRS